MARLRRRSATRASDDASERLRACWLYYQQGLTQKDVADRLGVSRGTIVKLLEEAKARGEVRIFIGEGERRCLALAAELEAKFGLDEAIVAPAGEGPAAIAGAVGLALGQFLSEAVADAMTIGVGWGRTLTASLSSILPARRRGVKIVSLVGGLVAARGANPLEFAWRLAAEFDAECYAFVAPVLVDTPETKRLLDEESGLAQIFRLARQLDVAVLGVGDVARFSGGQAATLVSPHELDELLALGAVADVLCNFLDRDGFSVAHPVNARVMSASLDDVRRAKHVVLASGGANRAMAIRAAMRRVGCNTLVTDESAARALVEIADGPLLPATRGEEPVPGRSPGDGGREPAG